jgi:hypothetical protein
LKTYHSISHYWDAQWLTCSRLMPLLMEPEEPSPHSEQTDSGTGVESVTSHDISQCILLPNFRSQEVASFLELSNQTIVTNLSFPYMCPSLQLEEKYVAGLCCVTHAFLNIVRTRCHIRVCIRRTLLRDSWENKI